MKIWKKFTSQLIILGIICLIAAFSYVKSEILPTNADIDSTKTIIIDAGHGGLTNTTDQVQNCREISI